MRGRVAATVAFASLVVLLGGCGDDDAPITTISTEAETTEATGASVEEFIVSADARCAEANAALAAVGTDSSSIGIGQRLEITQEVLSGLQGLGAPEDPDGDLAAYLQALKAQISLLEEQESAAATNDTATVESLQVELDAAEADALAAGEAFGFEDCGQPPSAVEGGTTTTSPGGTAPADPTATTPVTPAPETPVEPIPAEPVTPPAGGTDTGGEEVPAPEPEPSGSGGFSP